MKSELPDDPGIPATEIKTDLPAYADKSTLTCLKSSDFGAQIYRGSYTSPDD